MDQVEHCGWCRLRIRGQNSYGADIVTFEACDSDDDGAFKVYCKAEIRDAVDRAIAQERERCMSHCDFRSRMCLEPMRDGTPASNGERSSE